MKNKLIIFVAVLFVSYSAFAQDYVDAYRYSNTQYGGSARSVAMGSAFGALGGDFISASINPGGIGFYRSGELAFTPSINVRNIEANYLNSSVSDSKYNFNFNNISYVTTLDTRAESGIVGLTFGFGYNRLKNFHSNMMIEGNNAQTTLLDYFTDYANQGYWDQYEEAMVEPVGLLPFDTLTNQYWNDINVDGYGQSQRKSVNQYGKIDEYLFTMATNINHRAYIGFSVGIHNVEFEKRSHFTEWDPNNDIIYFDNYTFNRNLTTTGIGINFKLGAVFRPTKNLRLGAAVHTPTFYELNDYYWNSVNQTNDYGEYYENESPTGDYSYELETPLKAVFSAAYTFNKKALFSVDYEYIDYSTSKLRNGSDDYAFAIENKDIQDIFTNTQNIRFGAEYRVTSNFSLRGGYGIYGNGFATTYNGAELAQSNDTFSSYSAGFGYRQNDFFFDFAYRLNSSTEKHEVHFGSEFADLTSANSQVNLTFGFKF